MALFDELRSFLAEVETQQEKAASAKKTKKAEANTEAGSYEGGTSHPVKSVDDQTEDAHEGARSSENSSDVKKQVPAGGVDSASDSTPDQEGQQFDVGITSTATGEDPANEDNFKGTKDDPGTTAKAKTEDGEKYSSMNFSKLKGLTEKKANALMAGISVVLKQAELHGDQHKLDKDKDGKIEGSDLKAIRNNGEAKEEATEEKKEPAAEMKAAAAVGYDQAVQAGVDSNEDLHSFFKSASENLIRGALSAATATGEYLAAFNKQLSTKVAGESEEHEKGEGEGHEESESPAQEAGEEAGDLGLDEGDMAAMAGGAPGAEGGDAGSVDELLSALAEMGVTPDQVMEALGGGMGGGMPPEAAGLPPEAAAPAGDMMAAEAAAPKMAAANPVAGLLKAAKARARSGKFQISAAKTAQQRQLRDEIKKCIAEIVA
jgi:hypothetical protein